MAMPPRPQMNFGAGGGDLQFFNSPAPGGFPPPGQAMPGMAPPQPFGGAPTTGSMGQMGGPPVTTFVPPQQTQSYAANDDDFENEPPILEELGINVDHVVLRMKGVALFHAIDEVMLQDADLSGPLAILMSLNGLLMLSGKLLFGYVYGFGASGCIFIYMLINVMSQKGQIDLYSTASILGYGLMPLVGLAGLGVVTSLRTTMGTVATVACVMWATAASSRFFATAVAMQKQRWLVAYPVGLFYTVFSLLTVF